jgi:hypothetical protein
MVVTSLGVWLIGICATKEPTMLLCTGQSFLSCVLCQVLLEPSSQVDEICRAGNMNWGRVKHAGHWWQNEMERDH